VRTMHVGCETILLAASRTVTGGDAFAKMEVLFGVDHDADVFARKAEGSAAGGTGHVCVMPRRDGVTPISIDFERVRPTRACLVSSAPRGSGTLSPHSSRPIRPPRRARVQMDFDRRDSKAKSDRLPETSEQGICVTIASTDAWKVVHMGAGGLPSVWMLFSTSVTHKLLLRPLTGDVVSHSRTLRLDVRPSALVFSRTAKKKILSEARRKSYVGSVPLDFSPLNRNRARTVSEVSNEGSSLSESTPGSTPHDSPSATPSATPPSSPALTPRVLPVRRRSLLGTHSR